jgi:hypothetical protein
MALLHHEYARLHDAVLTKTGRTSMANETANRECETVAIRDLEPVELDAIGGGQHQTMDIYHPNGGIQAFLRAFYKHGGS